MAANTSKGCVMSGFTIEGARVFDGHDVLGVRAVTVHEGTITEVGDVAPMDAERVDGRGATLLPGLIDAHTHADLETLGHALRFGVTTELDLFSFPQKMAGVLTAVRERADVADVRTASLGMTAPGGHPTQLRGNQDDPELPTVGNPAEVPGFVDDRIAEGADYIKVLLESGKTLGKDVPVIDGRIVEAAVRAAHARGKQVIAHALTVDTTRQALAAGVDGFAHLFVDGPATAELVESMRASGVFMTPTLSTLASITNQHVGAGLARDERVAGKLPEVWMDNLAGNFNTYPSGDFETVLATVAALHRAGVPILAGTDASHLGAPGMAHGVSLHGELALLVRAGLSPLAALRAATSVPARIYGLADRGVIAPGARADLLLVEGDPVTTIGDTLSIRDVWRSGSRTAR
jgi:imidazolonepropionase-like amidohydrolase